MLSEKMTAALNKQVAAEFYSAYLYVSMAGYFDSIGLKGFSNWMKCQAQEELLHGMKMFNFISERGGRTHSLPIDGPRTEWGSPTEVFEDTLKHERHVTSLINNLVNIAISESDHATNNFLQWFVAEQVEEESSATGVLDQLKLAKGDPNATLLLDRELATRTFTMPPAAGTGGAPKGE